MPVSQAIASVKVYAFRLPGVAKQPHNRGGAI
jgi:hypothetical protein